MKASKDLIEHIKYFEGCRLEAYLDSAGVATIGYGHTHNVRMGDKYSKYYADEMLRLDIEVVEGQLNELDVAKTQGQFDALVDFVFNLGIDNLKKSTLLKKIRDYNKDSNPKNITDKMSIDDEFSRWCYSKGKRLKGLEFRRKWEAVRFFQDIPCE